MSAIGTRRRGSRSRGDLQQTAEINVTSLVDVAFTLLIIFIITAPIMQGGIEVALPRADVRPLNAQESPIFITIMRDGTIMMEETPVTTDELAAGLSQLLAADNVERVYIRADSAAPWAPIIRTMATTLNSGVPWSAVAEPLAPE